MKKEQIQKNIKQLLIKFGIVDLILLGIVGFLYIYSDSLGDDYYSLKSRASSLESEIRQKNNTYFDAEENLESFLRISNNRLPTETGYKESYQRIKQILPNIEKFKDLYSFKKLTFTLGKIEENRDYSKTNFDAYSGSLSLYFEGASDQFVFSFINDLKNSMPGYLKIDDFYISKKEDLSNIGVRSFLTVKNFYFVTGKIDLNWITFKFKEGNKRK